MAKINIDASELDDAQENLVKLIQTSVAESRNLQNELSDMMIDFIKKAIRVNFDDVRTRSDQTSLLDAFIAFPAGDKVVISTAWSDADHARPLEDGVMPHYITPNDGEALAFAPDNPSDYPESARVGGGFVLLNRVYWTPDKAPGGYKYVLEGQRNWQEPANMKTNDALERAIRSAGFSRL